MVPYSKYSRQNKLVTKSNWSWTSHTDRAWCHEKPHTKSSHMQKTLFQQDWSLRYCKEKRGTKRSWKMKSFGIKWKNWCHNISKCCCWTFSPYEMGICHKDEQQWLRWFCASVQSHLNLCMNRHMTKPTKWPVRPSKTQISLGICPVWSESSLSAWRNVGPLTTYWAHTEDWSDWVNAQADQSYRWAHMSFCWFWLAGAQL